MKILMHLLIFLLILISDAVGMAEGEKAQQSSPQDHLVVVVGASGSDEFAETFRETADQWKALAEQSKWNWTLIEPSPTQDLIAVDTDSPAANEPPKEIADKKNACHIQLQNVLTEASRSSDARRLWLVLIGHGTSTNGVTKFNLDGPDVTPGDLKTWLGGGPQEQCVVACFSSSGTFLTELASENRILVTATRSGSEMNYSRFGKYMAESLQSLASDLDHDEEVSLLEAFLAASKSTARFYRDESRLATEHSLIDDNGDRLGTSAEFFQGVMPIKSAKDQAQIDGIRASRIILFSSPDAIRLTDVQEAARMEIEAAIDRIKANRAKISADEYYRELELQFVQLAKIYAQAEDVEKGDSSDEAAAAGISGN